MSVNITDNMQVAANLSDLRYLVFQGMAGKAPRVNPSSKHWEVWDNDTQAWVDTGVSTAGESSISEDVKVALLNCFQNVAWINDAGQTHYDALEAALYPPKTLVSISAAFNQGSAVVHSTDSLDTLRQYLTVTATYDDSSTGVVTNYTLSGTLVEGESTIAVLYNGKSTTFTVNVTAPATIDSISAVFTQGDAVIYDTDALDTLKQYLTVTATYDDQTTQTVTNYTLSGTLTAGTSTITVSYGGKTTTFNVTVTHAESGEIEMMPVVQANNMTNCPKYSDGGETVATDTGFESVTNGKPMRSVRVFDNDVTLKITYAPTANAYQQFLFTSTLWDGETTIYSGDTVPFYYCEPSKNTFPYGWSSATHVFEYTVKAGYAFCIVGFPASDMNFFTVEVA